MEEEPGTQGLYRGSSFWGGGGGWGTRWSRVFSGVHLYIHVAALLLYRLCINH